MFEKETDKNITQPERDINLLPEDLRRREAKLRQNENQENGVAYTRVDDMKQSRERIQQLSWWDRVKAVLGRKFSRSAPVSRERMVSSPANPLRQLYSRPPERLAVPEKQPGRSPQSSTERSQSVAPAGQPASVSGQPPLRSPQPPVSGEKVVRSARNGRPLSVLERIDQQLQKGGVHLGGGEENTDQYGVNLIPEELVSEANEKKVRSTLGLAVLMAVLVIGVAYLAIEFIQFRQAKIIQEYKQDIKKAENDFIAKSSDLQALIRYQQTYDNIKSLLDSHLYWTKFFDFLETNVADDVYFKDVSADKNGLVTLGLVAKSYESLASQYEIFKQDPAVNRVEIAAADLVNPDTTDDTLPLVQGEGSLATIATSSEPVDLRDLLLRSYQKMSVRAQVQLELKKDIFYRQADE